jgi:hypothetical protein
MRPRLLRLALIVALYGLANAGAVAQTPPPGYTPLDLAEQAKLRRDLGTWNCTSIPAGAPVTVIETEQGNWFVARATGGDARTTYERWSHALKSYVLVSVFDSGASDVERTASLDADNATWTPMWPPLDNQGRKRFEIQVARAGGVLRSSSRFYDANGNVQTATTTCTKQ